MVKMKNTLLRHAGFLLHKSPEMPQITALRNLENVNKWHEEEGLIHSFKTGHRPTKMTSFLDRPERIL